jgi:hypothetical protein
MNTFKGIIRNGRVIVIGSTGLPDGTEVEILPVVHSSLDGPIVSQAHDRRAATSDCPIRNANADLRNAATVSAFRLFANAHCQQRAEQRPSLIERSRRALNTPPAARCVPGCTTIRHAEV